MSLSSRWNKSLLELSSVLSSVAPHVTKLGFPETRLGIIPGAGGTQRAPRVIGLARAKELIFTGRTIDAVEAKEIGVWRVFFLPFAPGFWNNRGPLTAC
jgi:1,4-dihydroxy-2-naphthoyl-CoA synthase